MIRNIQAVLFDLGDTLMYPRAPWPPVFQQAGQVLGEYLCANNITIDCSAFSDEFRTHLDQYFIERERSLIETSSLAVLQELLANKGYQDLTEKFLQTALDHYYGITQQNWVLEPDAIPTLAALQTNGLRLALISNASDSHDVFTLVENFGIGKYLDFILTSADCGYRKPHPHIFKLALSKWNYMPDELAMVGDRLDADIGGARPLGIYTIWMNRYNRQPGHTPIPPDASVHTLSEIPPLLLNRPKST